MNYYSQAGQDKFVLHLLNHTHNGFFVDIGCGAPIKINNTYALEQLGWEGISFDIMEREFSKFRKTLFVNTDVRVTDFDAIFSKYNIPRIVDYLSLDVDDSTYDALVRIPFNKHYFKIITIEHDRYRLGDSLRIPQREFLTKNGYQLICGDVICDEMTNVIQYFEDWWIYPDFFDKSQITPIICKEKFYYDII